jgi:anti-sigma-K factor RskA
MTDPERPDELNDLAAEHALGVLDGEERLRAQALQRSDPRFAASVEAWQVRLAPLLREVAEGKPGDHLWDGISGRIFGSNDNALRSARRWRAATLVSGAIAASLAVIMLVDPGRTPAPAPVPAQVASTQHIAQLVDPQGKPLLTIGYDRQAGTMKISEATLGAEGRVPELWVIPADGKPRSLGELTANGTSRAMPPAQLQQFLSDGATLAITLEKREGIPHAAPSGSIIASGTVTSI